MADYTRKANMIIEHGAASPNKHFESINKAKKESRRLQAEGHTVKRG